MIGSTQTICSTYAFSYDGLIEWLLPTPTCATTDSYDILEELYVEPIKPLHAYPTLPIFNHFWNLPTFVGMPTNPCDNIRKSGLGPRAIEVASYNNQV